MIRLRTRVVIFELFRKNSNYSMKYSQIKLEGHWGDKVRTRRERLKSALYLRLKKRKTFFLEKNLKFSKKKFLSENVAVPKNVKGGGGPF